MKSLLISLVMLLPLAATAQLKFVAVPTNVIEVTFGSGSGSGSGSGFPLTEDGDLAGYSLTNGAFAGDGNGLTNLPDLSSIYATGTPLYAFTETDPNFVSWMANDFTGAVEALVESIAVTGAVTSINGEEGAVTVEITGAGVTTNSATSWTIAAGGSGGTSTKTIGGKATDWAWSGSAYCAPRTTNGVTFLEFPLDRTNLINGTQLTGIDGIAVTQIVYAATAYPGGGTFGMLTGFDGRYTTNLITVPTYPDVVTQAVSVSHSVAGISTELFRHGVLPTNVIGSATGVVWYKVYQARGAW